MAEPRERNSWHAWYSLPRWIRRAKAQRRREPLCVECLRKGLAVPADVADHIEPHKGDPNKFWLGALQSLCHQCHSRHKQSFEVRGHSLEIGLDGFPVDAKHPAYTYKLGDRVYGRRRSPPRPAVAGGGRV
jgi:5-methylcytosine-specific restriction enzyme A